MTMSAKALANQIVRLWACGGDMHHLYHQTHRLCEEAMKPKNEELAETFSVDKRIWNAALGEAANLAQDYADTVRLPGVRPEKALQAVSEKIRELKK